MINITLDDWITSSNNHPERAQSQELTDDIKISAKVLCDKVNNFLNELGWNELVKLTSGFRTLEVNASTPNAAKHSGHEDGHAMDIWDDHSQTLANLVETRPDLLRKHGLMMEDKRYTLGKNTNWVHLDMVPRVDRASRTFIP